jgi:chromosome segregation ATPase
MEQSIAAELQKTIKRLEAEREKFAEEASNATINYNKALEEVKIGVMTIEDLSKQIDDAAARLAEQQQMYEQVRTDRNLYSKKLIESQDEISELKQKFKIMDHQIDQLKEELGMKEKKYFEELARQKNEKEKLTKIRKQVNEYTSKFDEAKKRSEGANQEIKQLTKVINQCDTELSEQQQQFLTVTNERDVLGTQLIRRNDELALLYEKIRIQQQTLSKGEVQYRDRLVDIRMLRLKIAELKRNVHMAQVRVKNIDDLKAHIVTLQRQLALERTKVQALSEELENPQNYLRWRKIEGEDLSEAEMVQKIQTLQKRLITKTEECVEKDIIIQEKEKLYIELKTILARQPGPEVAEQLNVYQQDLRNKNSAMKRMASELNMSSTHLAEQKYEVERLNRELQEIKKKYFDLKMTNQTLMRERPARNAQTM